MKEKIFIVDNLKCGGCANSIHHKLAQVAGIDKIAVDPDTNSVRISYTQDTAAEKALSLLAQMGYPEAGTSSILQKGKSYISCAIGRIKPAPAK